MIRLCKSVIGRSFLQSRILTAANNQAGVKQSIEKKIGLPEKPKKPLTPYFRFLVKIRPEIKQKFPEAKTTDITQMAGQQWAQADPELRRQLQQEYLQEMNVYMQQVELYKRSLTAEQKQLLVDSKIEMKERKERLELRKKNREMGKPKKPGSAFMIFLTEKIPSRGKEPYREFLLKVVKEWEEMDENAKRVYLSTQARHMDMYKKELQQWEEEMVRLGHIDLVRNEALMESPPKASSSKKAKAAKEK